jgi:STI1 domain
MGILQDPVMQSILQQAKGDPKALAEHMRNPQVRSKIQKVSLILGALGEPSLTIYYSLSRRA